VKPPFDHCKADDAVQIQALATLRQVDSKPPLVDGDGTAAGDEASTVCSGDRPS